MSNWHELTEKIVKSFMEVAGTYGKFWTDKELSERVDSIIRKWLEEKACKIHQIERKGYRGTEVREILGLSQEVEPKKCVHSYEPTLSKFGEYSTCGKCGYKWYLSEHIKPEQEVKMNPNQYIPPPKPETQEKWCACMDQISPSHTWMFCPWCGKPRPVKVSRRELLLEIIKKWWKEPMIPYNKGLDNLADAILACLDEGEKP